jgi:predicted nucleic acid-binding protein
MFLQAPLSLVLVTNNMGEFARVPALEAENWVHAAQ